MWAALLEPRNHLEFSLTFSEGGARDPLDRDVTRKQAKAAHETHESTEREK